MRGCSKKRGPDAENAVLDPNTKRYIHLDMMRVLAIFFVAVDHGFKEYSIANVLFTQSWVLQCLWVICGISWSLSRSPVLGYLLRLALYFVVGVVLNWLAWIAKGQDWMKDPMGVMYQFAFIIGLMAYSSLTVCLRAALKKTVKEGGEPAAQIAEDFRSDLDQPSDQSLTTFSRDGPMPKREPLLEAATPPPTTEPPLTASERRAVMIFTCALLSLWAVMAALGVLFATVHTEVIAKIVNLLLGESAKMWTKDLEDRAFFGQILATFGTFMLAFVGAKVFKSPRLAPYLVWVLVFFTYLGRIVILPVTFGQYGGGVARFFSGFELFLFGLTGAVMGMQHAASLRWWLGRYWLVMLIALVFIWNPTWNLRMDEHPPKIISVILRVQVSEMIWVVAFLASGALWFREESWPDWQRLWLSDFALALFLVHKAMHVAVPEPFNWLLIFPVLLLLTLWRRHGLLWLCGKGRPPWSRRTAVGVQESATASPVDAPNVLDSAESGSGISSGAFSEARSVE